MIAGTRVRVYANEIGNRKCLISFAPATVPGRSFLKRDTREAAEKKAAELRDMGYFEVEIVAKDGEKTA